MTQEYAWKALIGGIRVSPDAPEEAILNRAKEKMKRAGISLQALHFRLYKKSVDARRRDDIRFECTVLCEAEEGTAPSERRLARADARLLKEASHDLFYGTSPLSAPPVVVGMGPAGLFAAYLLAKNGYRPVILDRGASVSERARDVERFRTTGMLDTESNVQFGAGGAGTFSDGKLVTRIHDSRCTMVLETLHAFGAPDEILTRAKPHIGTDLLRTVVQNMLDEIARLGGRVLYRCRLDDFSETTNGTLALSTTQGELEAGALILAIGHSARDTYGMLMKKSFAMEPKPLSLGVRIEHLQEELDRALYGRFAGHPNLGHAEYALSDTRGERGIYTFCMCPGGEVMAAASEEESVVVNGMSNYARDGRNANAALLVSVGVKDIEPVNGSPVLGAIALQRRIERAAFLAGGSDYSAPVMTVGDLLSGTHGTEPSRIRPSYRDGRVRVADLTTLFPDFVSRGIADGIRSFGRRIEGFDAPDAVLTGAETRTSAPLRILRHSESMTAPGHDLIYPVGEGAGYAGGITSASVDGVRVAEALMARFAPIEKETNR